METEKKIDRIVDAFAELKESFAKLEKIIRDRYNLHPTKVGTVEDLHCTIIRVSPGKDIHK